MNNPAAAETTARFVRPRSRILETSNGYVAEIEMPGVNKDRLEVTFENGELTVTGRRNVSTPAGAELMHRESNGADYRRVFELDGTVDASAITAALDQGLLILQLPKAEAAKGRRIEVSGLN